MDSLGGRVQRLVSSEPVHGERHDLLRRLVVQVAVVEGDVVWNGGNLITNKLLFYFLYKHHKIQFLNLRNLNYFLKYLA